MSNSFKINATGGLRIPILSSDPSSPEDGSMWYNSTDSAFKKRENGATSEIAAETLTDAEFRIVGSGDNTKQLAFEVDGIATATTRTITMPNENLNLDSLNPGTGTFANATLSNLGTTSINSNLIPNGSKNLGGSGASWSSAFISLLTNSTDITINQNFRPNGLDNIIDFGSSSFNWKDLHARNLVSNDVLTLNGTNINASSKQIKSVADPTLAQDAATKNYVDSVAQGLDVKESVRAASTANTDLTVAGDGTLDGVTLANNDRVLLKDQTTGSENGIYDAVTATDRTTWVRSSDADEDAEVTAGMFTFVEEGTTNADSGWVLTTDNPITVGTTALAFSQFSGAGAIEAGAGLTKTGNTIDVGDINRGVQANADDLELDASESSGNGIKANATNSWQFDVEADTTSTTTTEANAISVGVNGVSVKVDDSSLEGSGQGATGAESLRIKDAGVTDAKIAAGVSATKIADGSVDNTEFQHLDGVTSNIQTQLNAKLENVVEDTTPQLGGNLDTNTFALLHDTNGLKRGNTASPTALIEEEYVDSVALADNTTAVVADFTFAAASYNAMEIEYLIREATSLETRVGKIMVVTDGSTTSISDTFSEVGDPGVTWSAAINTGNVEISYTTTSTTNARTMRADLKRFRAI